LPDVDAVDDLGIAVQAADVALALKAGDVATELLGGELVELRLVDEPEVVAVACRVAQQSQEDEALTGVEVCEEEVAISAGEGCSALPQRREVSGRRRHEQAVAFVPVFALLSIRHLVVALPARSRSEAPDGLC